MPLAIVCTHEHTLLAEPADLAGADGPGPCADCGAPTALQSLPLPEGPTPGQMPPGFRVLRRLEGATMAAVYRACHRSSRQTVALKVGLAGRDARKADHDRLRREARLLAALRSPGLARLVDAGEHAGLPFLATAWLPGGSLADRLASGPPPPRAAVGWLAAVSRAVHSLHLRGVAHLDLRPPNVLFSRRGVPTLIDLGLARRLVGPAGVIRGGSAWGDPRYMAPEQTGEGGVAVGPAAEVYALGALLFQALTGRLPFRGVCLRERLRRTRLCVPRLAALRPELPSALDAVCRRCLRRNPEQRYATAGALADALREVLQGW
jgi:serine/threonine-protein kinase